MQHSIPVSANSFGHDSKLEDHDDTKLETSTQQKLSTDAVDTLLHQASGWWNARFCWQFLCVSLSWVLFGYDVSFVSGLIGLPLFVKRFQGPLPNGILAFDATSLNLLIPVSVCGTALAPFAGPFLQKRFGRKKTLIIAFGLCCIPASFLQLFAPNMGAMAFGRMWNYFGIGLTQQIVPLYVTEMTPARYRATLTGLSGGFNLLIGVFTTIIMWGCAKITNDHQWKIPLAIQAGLPILLLGATLTLQESTSWLISKGRIEEATALHRNLRPAGMEDLVEAEMAAMVLSYGEQKKVANVSIKEIFTPRHIKRTIAASLVGCLSACSGYSLTATYGVVILIQAGLSEPYKWQILTAVLGLLGLCIGSVALDKVGRRPLLIYGFAVIAALDMVAGGIATTGLHTQSLGKALASVSILLSFVVNVVFAATYTLNAEIPSISLRENTIAYCGFTNSAATIISYFVTPYLLTAPGNLGARTYLVFGGFMTVAVGVAFYLIPETKNRSWMEIDELYNAKVPSWRWSTYQTSLSAVTETTNELKNANAHDV